MKYYGCLKMPLEARREAVAELAETGLSNVAIGDVLGVNHSTVVRDRAGANAPLQDERSEETKPPDEASGADAPPPRQVDIRRCDFRKLPGSLTNVDVIITDPPYERAAIPLYGEPARQAEATSDARRRRFATPTATRPWVENKNGARALCSASASVAKRRPHLDHNGPKS